MLKDKSICIFHSASNKDISQFWSAILALENTMEQHEKYNQGNVTDYPNLCAFINHCCQVEHYTFGILKCGIRSCSICKPVRLLSHVFGRLWHLSHPVPGEDELYLLFSEVFKINTTGEFHPFLQKKLLNVEAYLSMTVYNMLKTVSQWYSARTVKCGDSPSPSSNSKLPKSSNCSSFLATSCTHVVQN